MLGWYILLIKKNRNNKKNQDNQSFWKISAKCNNFIYYVTKIVPLYSANYIVSFNFFKFSWFEQSINTLKFKASASDFYYFQICKKSAWQFKILTVLYFYRFIITFNLTLHQVLLVLEWNKVRIVFNKCPVSPFHLHLKTCNNNSL